MDAPVFDFGGRLRRRDYVRLVVGFYGAALVSCGLLYGLETEGGIQAVLLGLTILLLAAATFVTISAMARRWQDIGRTGWWAALFFLPIVNLVMALYLALMPGRIGGNRYGPDPKEYGSMPRVRV